MNILLAAVTYWVTVFAVGFFLGTIRTLWLAPHVGLFAATALELPVILLASWLLAGWTMRRWAITQSLAGIAMGMIAFALLMIAESALAVTVMQQTLVQWLDGFAEPHAMLGLAGQALFALIPWIRLRRAG